MNFDPIACSRYRGDALPAIRLIGRRATESVPYQQLNLAVSLKRPPLSCPMEHRNGWDGRGAEVRSGALGLVASLKLAESAGVVSFMGAAVHQLYAQATALGFGNHFLPSLIEAQAKIHGITVGSTETSE